MRALVHRDRFAVTVVLVGLLFAGLCVWRTVDWSWGADTGTFFQAIRAAGAGFLDGPERGSHLRFHWSPALALLWPVAAAFPSPLALQWVQVAAIVGCAPLLRALVAPYVGEPLATRAGLLCLLYPPLLAIAFEEFHELGLWPIVALGLVYAADRARWPLFGALLVVAVGIREDVCLVVACFGLGLIAIGLAGGRKGRGLLAASPRDRRATVLAGGAAAILALGSLAVYYGLVIPRYGPWAPSHFYQYPFAVGPVAVVRALVTEPLTVLHAIATPGRATYLAEAIVPLAFLPFLSTWSALALPGLAICLLSSLPLAWRMGGHYVALWAPFALLGAGLAVRRAGRRWTTVAIALCVLVLIAFDPMHPAHYLRPSYARLDDARRALACVPRAASVSTHDEWYSATIGAHPAASIALWSGVDWLVYADDYDNAEFRTIILPAVEREAAAGRYVLRCASGHVRAYARSASP